MTRSPSTAAYTLRRWRAPLLACVLALMLAGCGGREAVVDPEADANALFERAYRSLSAGNYPNAIRYYEQLMARYPFSDVARQAQIDIIYAYYRNGEPESAVDAADTFIRENPTHPRVDYGYYMRGLIYFAQGPGLIERLFRADVGNRPPQDAQRSFSAFSQLLQRYPDSPYAEDARQRMIYLRNRLAEYEMHVARYYIRRGAYVAAANRARNVLETYSGSPSISEALEVLVVAYWHLDLPELAADAEAVLRSNYPEVVRRLTRRGILR